MKPYDLRTGNVQPREVLRAEMSATGPATAIDCSVVSITDGRPDAPSLALLSRVMRMMRNNQGLSFELAAGPDAAADSTGPGISGDEAASSIIKFLKDRGVPNTVTMVRGDGPAGSLMLRVAGK